MATNGELIRRGGGGVQARALRAGGWTKAAREDFLAELAQTANVRAAAQAAGLSEQGAYKLRKRDPGFAQAWGEALSEGYGRLEMLMLERAIAGMAGDAVPETDGATGPKISERTIMTLLTHHRQSVREFRELRDAGQHAPTGMAPESDEEIKARLLAIFDEMHDRLAAARAD